MALFFVCSIPSLVRKLITDYKKEEAPTKGKLPLIARLIGHITRKLSSIEDQTARVTALPRPHSLDFAAAAGLSLGRAMPHTSPS